MQHRRPRTCEPAAQREPNLACRGRRAIAREYNHAVEYRGDVSRTAHHSQRPFGSPRVTGSRRRNSWTLRGESPSRRARTTGHFGRRGPAGGSVDGGWRRRPRPRFRRVSLASGPRFRLWSVVSSSGAAVGFGSTPAALESRVDANGDGEAVITNLKAGPDDGLHPSNVSANRATRPRVLRCSGIDAAQVPGVVPLDAHSVSFGGSRHGSLQ